MAFCIKCGTQVGDTDKFCGGCGAVQEHAAAGEGNSSSASEAPSGAAKAASGPKEWLNSLDPKTASMLCYIPVIGWIGSVIVLASERYRNSAETRFHAFQGLYLFVVYLIVEHVLAPILRFENMGFQIDNLLKLALLGTWVFLMVKTSQGIVFRLPVLGELADRSVSEQR